MNVRLALNVNQRAEVLVNRGLAIGCDLERTFGEIVVFQDSSGKKYR
jgi:hypothetical protein